MACGFLSLAAVDAGRVYGGLSSSGGPPRLPDSSEDVNGSLVDRAILMSNAEPAEDWPPGAEVVMSSLELGWRPVVDQAALTPRHDPEL